MQERGDRERGSEGTMEKETGNKNEKKEGNVKEE